MIILLYSLLSKTFFTSRGISSAGSSLCVMTERESLTGEIMVCNMFHLTRKKKTFRKSCKVNVYW